MVATIRILVLTVVALFGAWAGFAQSEASLRPEWGRYFEAHAVQGTIVVKDERASSRGFWVYNPERARQQWIPASTYKIPHAIFALEAGAVRDEFEVFRWDGVERAFPGHNQDQDLRSSMRVSAVWVYEIFAKRIGEKRVREFLRQSDYGNADPSGDTTAYWLDGNLRISAFEQIAFLQRLFRNELPFKREHQLMVKDILVNQAGKDWILRAKTGWTGEQGWWVGWVEWPDGPVFFALHIDTPRRGDDLPKREAIVREILKSINALP
jgi:beta-lactamase class D